MNHPAFQAVCRQVSLGLEAAEPDALGERRPSSIGGETFECMVHDDGSAALLVTYLGTVDTAQAQAVYEQLLLLQLASWNNPDLRFGFDPVTGQVLLCTRLPAPASLEAAPLDSLIRRLLKQLGEWRGTLLHPLVPQKHTQEA
ncbi:CesT family type III secretion system chaperone [Hydrogenophaga sp. IBVHS2]|uniref:CesT family type III secretion system chaperone n=1 Tax=Hydrogenophaga sp. IBVHS2 TaxID=1985170 RepID=UPI0015C50C75|nr:CesT family type III secretion system chaperone [Hydrogenophaga sp. IBVHS2]